MTNIIDGKSLAQTVRFEVREQVTSLRKLGIQPGLAVVLAGDDPASASYVRSKTKACEEVGIHHFDYRLPSAVSENELLQLIHSLNTDPSVHGILVQLPLPDAVDSKRILMSVSPQKDVDGFHPVNLGRLMSGEPGFIPCTPRGILRMLEHAQTPLQGARAVVVGRSLIVGKPIGLLLLAEHATVTFCHSRTQHLPEVISQADVVIAAVGAPEFIKGAWIQSGATVIDVGINRVDHKIVGDVEFSVAAERARAISPVPKGVGPMTVAMLLSNTVQAAAEQSGAVSGF